MTGNHDPNDLNHEASWSIFDAVEEYFSPDDDQAQEEYFNHYDGIRKLFYSATGANIHLANSCVRTYLKCTPPVNVKPSILCYLMFQSHIDRHPALCYGLNTKYAPLNEDQIETLSYLEQSYNFCDLHFTVSDVDVQIRIDADFKADMFDEDAIEITRLKTLSASRDCIEAYQNQLAAVPYIEDFFFRHFQTMHHLQAYSNRNMQAEIESVNDQVLDIYNQYKSNKRRENGAFLTYSPSSPAQAQDKDTSDTLQPL